MNQLQSVINQINEKQAKTNIASIFQMPSILVVGAQSVGKTSVLEAMMGIDILPKGIGAVTRCPIEIYLKHTPQAAHPWVEFEMNQGKKYSNKQEIQKAISELMLLKTGNKQIISSSPLRLTLFSADVIDLFLVDLPGLPRLSQPNKNNQQGVEVLVKEMIQQYCKVKYYLILAVVKSTDSDIDTTETWDFINEIDPYTNNTLGIITHLDLANEPSNNLPALINEFFPLKLGYVGLVLRSQNNIQSKSLEQQMMDEKKWFLAQPLYRSKADKLGISYLQKFFKTYLLKFIVFSQQGTKQKLKALYQQKSEDFKSLGDVIQFQNNSERSMFILTSINRYYENFISVLAGEGFNIKQEFLQGGSRIQYIFKEYFQRYIHKIDPFDVIQDNEIRIALKNAAGMQSSLFIKQAAFDTLVQQQISRLKKPCLQLAQLIYEEIKSLVTTINIPQIAKYTNMTSQIMSAMLQMIEQQYQTTQQMIENLIQIELGYINTNNPVFLKGSQQIQAHIQQLMLDYENNVQKFNQKLQESQQQMSQKQQQPKQPNQKQEDSEQSNKWWKIFGGRQESPPQKQQDQDSSLNEGSYANSSGKKMQIGNFLSDSPQDNLPKVPEHISLWNQMNSNESVEVYKIKMFVKLYFSIVKSNLSDTVPKAIITLFVNNIQERMHTELIQQIYKRDKLEYLLVEDQVRSELKTELAQEIINIKEHLDLLNDLDTKY